MDSKIGAKLRVTLVLPHTTIPSWLRHAMSGLLDADYVSLSVIVLSDQSCPYIKGNFLFRLWKWLDYHFFRHKLSDVRQSEVLVDITERWFTENGCSYSRSMLEDVTEVISKSEAHTVVWLAFERPPSRLLQVAKCGVWTALNAISASVGFRELIEGNPVTACTLIRYGCDPDDDRILSQAFSATDRLSLSRSLVGIRAKDQALLMSILKEAHRRGTSPSTDRISRVSTESGDVVPGPVELVSGLAKTYGRYVVNFSKRPFYFTQWQLAYRDSGERLSQDGLARLAPDHRGFWADPFVIRRDGRTVVFFEEVPESECRGRIAFVEIEAGGKVSKPDIVLECSHHLSYPFLIEFQGELFMIPESADSEKIEAYRCVDFPHQWEPHAVLIDGIRAFDPTLIECDGLWWMFVTIQHDGNSNADELHLFYASTPFDTWTPHPLNPINLDVRSARPAGALFWEQGQLFRPAQDCSVRYGYALSIQKVLRMNTREYEEEEFHRILPDWAPDGLGTHTLNHADGFTVYDCLVQRRK